MAAKPPEVSQPEYLGVVEREDGSQVQLVRPALARDLVAAQAAIGDRQEELLPYLLARLVKLNGQPVSAAQVMEWESGLVQALEPEILSNVTAEPTEGSDPRSYPQDHQLSDGAIATLTEVRRIRHDTEANKLAQGRNAEVPYWLVSLLVKIDGESVRYDDLLDMPAGRVAALVSLVQSGKFQFKPTVKP